MNNYPPGITTKMIDDLTGPEDNGTEIDTNEGYTIVVMEANYPDKIYLQVCDKDENIVSEYTLNRGQALALVRAINERM